MFALQAVLQSCTASGYPIALPTRWCLYAVHSNGPWLMEGGTKGLAGRLRHNKNGPLVSLVSYPALSTLPLEYCEPIKITFLDGTLRLQVGSLPLLSASLMLDCSPWPPITISFVDSNWSSSKGNPGGEIPQRADEHGHHQNLLQETYKPTPASVDRLHP